jgi:nucleoside-diphosphate-sugar epimerase
MLLDRGHEVIGVDTGFYRDGWLYHSRRSRYAACLNKDLRHLTADDLHGCEAVVHLAELSNDPLGQLSPHVTYDINHAGTVALARQCKQMGIVRFVYTSSCSVYGVGADTYQTEASLPNPQTVYAKCKILVERDLSMLADDDFSPTFLRNATAYGPSPRMRFDLVLNNLAGLAWTTQEIRMTSDGTPWRPLVHVQDICNAIACALEAPRELVHNECFNVGATTENYQVREVAQIVAETFPGCILTWGTNDGDNRSYRVSFEKIQTRLPEFQCRWDVKKGAEQLRALFERIAMPHELFTFRAYTRLKQLEHLLRTRQIDDAFYWR